MNLNKIAKRKCLWFFIEQHLGFSPCCTKEFRLPVILKISMGSPPANGIIHVVLFKIPFYFDTHATVKTGNQGLCIPEYLFKGCYVFRHKDRRTILSTGIIRKN